MQLRPRNRFAAALLAVVAYGLVISATGVAADLPRLTVEEFRLPNGMLFLMVRRPAMPQVACRLAIRAGSALEQTGKTGIAHMLEHMLFKGTRNFGTLDPDRDRELQAQIESTYQKIQRERSKRQPDQERIAAGLSEMATLRRQVKEIFVPQAFSSQLNRNGAVGVNAFTSRDQTQYMASVPSDMLEQWFSIVSEQVFEPSWREFYVEKEVVQREWAFRYVNSPSGAAWLDLNATAYTAHPYRNPVIGWPSDMQRFSTSDAAAFHARYYTPTNAVCVLVGDVDTQQVKEWARRYFGRYPAGPPAPEAVTNEPEQAGPRQNIRYLKGARTPLVYLGFHGPKMGTDDFYALDALTMILSYGRSARLTQRLVNQGRAVSAWAHNPDNRYAGLILVGGSPVDLPGLTPKDDPDASRSDWRSRYLDACRQLEADLLEEIGVLKQEPVADRDLKRILKMNQRDFIDRMRSNESLAGTLATLEVQVGWDYLNRYLAAMANVTAADIQRVARRYFVPENRSSIYVIPGGRPDKPPESYREIRSVGTSAAGERTEPVDFANRSRYPTPDNWRHPLSFDRQPEKISYPPPQRLSIGQTEVFFIPDRQLPLVDLALIIRTGRVDLRPDQAGLAQLLESVLIAGGTISKSPEALAMALDESAVRLSVTIGEESAAVRLSVLKSDWEKGLALLREILLEPAFDPEVLNAARGQLVAGLKRQGEDARAVAFREAKRWHFKNHPYGRDPLEAVDIIPTLAVEDLTQFLRRHFVPANMVIAASGDIGQDKLVAGLTAFLGALPQESPPVRRLKDPTATPPVLALLDKPGQVQAQIALMLPGIQRSHPQFWDLSFLSQIFGGSDSLLYTRLRSDLGARLFGQFPSVLYVAGRFSARVCGV
jgi:predicted Zn-dependent peptidase